MMKSPFEAEDSTIGEFYESTLRRPLLADVSNDTDEALVTQLLSSSERSSRPNRRCQKLSRVHRAALSVTLLSLISLFASGWSTLGSCDLVAVRYPTGGVQLLVTAFGVWGYQQEMAHKDHNDPDNNDSNERAMTTKCVNYDGIQKNHPDVDLKDFFPVNKTIQTYSIVAFSSYVAAILATCLFLIISSAHPEVFTRSETERYPATGMTSTVTAAALLFCIAGFLHSILMHRLLRLSGSDNANTQSSSICSPDHSSCNIGSGGYWVVFTIFTSFLCGLVSSLAAFYVQRIRAGRSTRLC